jgi:uncharacterized protein
MGENGNIRRLIEHLQGIESAVVAFSGGLDSSFLLHALKVAGVRTLAVTGRSQAVPETDLADAVRVASELGVEHRFLDTCELEREGYLENSPERCFHCKDELYSRIREVAESEGMAHVLDGTNSDDLADHRPGRRAAREHGVLSPLAECGLKKEEIRAAAKGAGLSVADKPASPCLSSRFPYGVRITPGGLERVARAEGLLRSKGFKEFRVRDRGGEARIEVPEAEMEDLFTHREEIVTALKDMGYAFVALDLEGLISGKLNRGVTDPS